MRRLRVETVNQIDEAVAREVAGESMVIVLRSDVRVTAGWLGQVLSAAEKLAGGVGVLGAGDPQLWVYPAQETWTGAAQQVLDGVDSVRFGRPQVGVVSRGRTTTIAAVLIVKDEEKVLDACLAAVVPLVDETIVYDTGSSDRTVEIARRRGATVVEGYWNNDFGDARNRALAHCTAEWVLSLDADEVVSGDAAALRSRLAGEAHHVLDVPLFNTTLGGGETGPTFLVRRVFRRAGDAWVGALHERIKSTDDNVVVAPQPAPLRILHSGYQMTLLGGATRGSGTSRSREP